MNYTLEEKKSLAARFLELRTVPGFLLLMDISLPYLKGMVRHPLYKVWQITNKKGKKRNLCEPSWYLKLKQKQLNTYLNAVYFDIIPESTYGFIRKPVDGTERRDFLINAAQHCGRPFVINADIRNFFDSIQPRQVRDVFLKAPFHFDEELASAIAFFCLNRRTLPTGSPTSPILSNFIMLEVDRQLQALASQYQYTYTRYADDLTFSGEERPPAEFKRQLTAILSTHGFRLNQRKYRVLSRFGRQTVTGIVVNEKPNVNRKYKKEVRAMRYDWKTYGAEVAARNHYKNPDIDDNQVERFKRTVEAREQYIRQVETLNRKK